MASSARWAPADSVPLAKSVTVAHHNLSAMGSFVGVAMVDDAAVVNLASSPPAATPIPLTAHPRVFEVAMLDEDEDGTVFIAVLSTDGLGIWKQLSAGGGGGGGGGGGDRTGAPIPRLSALIALDLIVESTADRPGELRGVACVGNPALAASGRGSFACVGTSAGEVAVCALGTGGAASSSVARLLRRVGQSLHAAPISALCAAGRASGATGRQDRLASADDDGVVCVLGAAALEGRAAGGAGGGGGDDTISFPPPPGGVPCTCLAAAARDDLLLAGFATGNIRWVGETERQGEGAPLSLSLSLSLSLFLSFFFSLSVLLYLSIYLSIYL